MLFMELGTKATLNVSCGSPVYILPNSHITKCLDLHEPCLTLVCDKSRADRAFATTYIDNFALGITELVHTFARRGILDFRLSKRIRLAERHGILPVTLMIDAEHRLAYPLATRLEGIANAKSIREGDSRNGD